MKPMNKKNPLVREHQQTYDDYAAIDDGQRYELANGQLELMSPAPSVVHQVISLELLKKMVDTCNDEFLILYSPIDLILSPTEVRQPDLVVINRSRLHILTKRGIEGVPDLVVEIMSPSTIRRDKIDKLNVYARSGIPEYWIIEPAARTLEQHILDDNRYQLDEIYQGTEKVHSSTVSCVSFTMEEIMKSVDELPELQD